MKKCDIETHGSGMRGHQYPAINVKVYHFTDLSKHFPDSDEGTLSKAGEFAFNMACRQFWDEIQDTANWYFPDHIVKIYSAGRSYGWLIVEGLPEIESWDAIMVSRWSRFNDIVKKEVKWLTSDEQIVESVRANEWYKPMSEEFNMIDMPDGTVSSVPDLKKKAIEAGFGPIIKK